MHKNKNIIILFITLILVLINRKIKFYITVPYIRWFMVCYFNDMVGAITFVSYCNEVFRRYKSIVTSLWKIEILASTGNSKQMKKFATAEALKTNRKGKSLSYKIGNAAVGSLFLLGKSKNKLEQEQNYYDTILEATGVCLEFE